MTNINHTEAEHLNPAYKVEILPQQTDTNQVSSAKKSNTLSVYWPAVSAFLNTICLQRKIVEPLYSISTILLHFFRSLRVHLYFSYSITFPLKHFHNLV